MKSAYPKVSIITVNYNQAKVTEALLRSLRKISYPEYEIFVVDNGSNEDCTYLQQMFPEIHLIESKKNLGFAGGNNLAITVAKGEFVLLLNNDTEVTTDFLEVMVDGFQGHPSIGIMSPKILYYNSEEIIQYAGTSAIQPLTCRGFTFGYKEKDVGQYDYNKKTDLAHGACMLIRKEVIEKIGMLHEAYFLYYEEYDFCEKAKKEGFEIYYNGHAKIFHKESVSVGKLSPLKSFHMAKNRILFAKRNFNTLNKFTSIAFYLFIAMPKNILFEAIQGRFKNSIAIVRGVLWSFTK